LERLYRFEYRPPLIRLHRYGTGRQR
jgi:hypothetical protein